MNVNKACKDQINRAETKVKILESDKEELRQEIEELESKLKNSKSMNIAVLSAPSYYRRLSHVRCFTRDASAISGWRFRRYPIWTGGA